MLPEWEATDVSRETRRRLFDKSTHATDFTACGNQPSIAMNVARETSPIAMAVYPGFLIPSKVNGSAYGIQQGRVREPHLSYRHPRVCFSTRRHFCLD